jgi:predicted ATP-binding protein involved in virulence
VVTEEARYPTRVEADGRLPGETGGSRWGRERERDRPTTRTNRLLLLARTFTDDVRAGRELVLPLLAAYRVDPPAKAPKSAAVLDMALGSRLDGYVGCLDGVVDTASLSRWFAQRQGAELQERNGAPADLAAVRRALADALPLCRHVRFSFQHVQLFVGDGGGALMPFHQLSDGYRRMFALVADLARRAAVLNPQLGADAVSQTPGVVLIDELDLHLHPRWQREVVGALKRAFPCLQFIATTHSPFIIQSLRPGELVRLEGEPAYPYADESVEDILEDVMGIALPQRSRRLERLRELTAEYQRLLAAGETVEAGRAAKVQDELDDLMARFASDDASAALYAFLERKRLAAGLAARP